MTNCKLNIVFEEQSHCENTGVADRQFALFVSNRHRIVATQHKHTHIYIGHNWCAVTIVTFPRHYELNIEDVPLVGEHCGLHLSYCFFSEYTSECAFTLPSRKYLQSKGSTLLFIGREHLTKWKIAQKTSAVRKALWGIWHCARLTGPTVTTWRPLEYFLLY